MHEGHSIDIRCVYLSVLAAVYIYIYIYVKIASLLACRSMDQQLIESDVSVRGPSLAINKIVHVPAYKYLHVL